MHCTESLQTSQEEPHRCPDGKVDGRQDLAEWREAKAEWFSKVWSAKPPGTGTAGTKWERKGWAKPVERCQGDLGKQPARSKGFDRRTGM